MLLNQVTCNTLIVTEAESGPRVHRRSDDSRSAAAAYAATSRQSTARRVAFIVNPQSTYIVHSHQDSRTSQELQRRNLVEFQGKFASLRQGYSSYVLDDSTLPHIQFTVQISVAEFLRSVTLGMLVTAASTAAAIPLTSRFVVPPTSVSSDEIY